MTLLLIRPVKFDYNPMTAVNNAFQKLSNHTDNQKLALDEFNGLVRVLNEHDIETLVVEDTPDPHTPDSIFPNNWISFHEDNSIVLYPMFAENRRLERKEAVLIEIRDQFQVDKIVDYSDFEAEGRYLEGTGSFVLDRVNKIAYACRSPRTNEGLFKSFCADFEYKPVLFDAYDNQGQEIYHTNVMMCVADQYAVVNLHALAAVDRPVLMETLENSGKQIIDITHEQMNHFAGNMLQVESRQGHHFLVMSSQAFESLNQEQKDRLSKFNPLIHAPLYTIERNGGGSCRCMLAEVCLNVKT
jgi:hypothetical protein